MRGNDDVRFYVILLIIQVILSIIYGVYIIIDERKKVAKKENFFKYTLRYEMDYFLYIDMVKKMRIVLFKKKMQLFLLSVLVLLRRMFVWKKN
ncbi:MAG: hypothetical protein L6V91_00025 [Bacilli bacterium]|nr:MAG: hypothetical protein L6V91_00025 [Bacilli bacterium]